MNVTSKGKVIFTPEEWDHLQDALEGNVEANESLKRLLHKPSVFDD